MTDTSSVEKDSIPKPSAGKLRSFFGRDSVGKDTLANDLDKEESRPTKWSMGVLNDRQTHEVPGMHIILLVTCLGLAGGVLTHPARMLTAS
jgi:hypothetical protein